MVLSIYSKSKERSGTVPILASVVTDTMELLRTSSPSYFTENIVTSTALGMAERRVQIAN
jgi:hypothetical protein